MKRINRHRIFIWAVLLVVSFPAHGNGEPGDQQYIKARELLAAGRTAEAAKSFERALSENPVHIEARYQLALIHMGNVLTFEKAEEELLDLPGIAMGAGEKIRNDLLFRSGLALGKLYVKSGRHAQAIQLLRNVIASAPAGAPLDEAYNTLGLANYYERLYDDAIFELRRAIKQNPNNASARFNLKTIRARLEHFQAGKIYARMQEREEAIVQFRQAIALDPRFVEARHRLGIVLMEKGDFAESLKELRRADAISDRYRKAYEIWYAEGLVLRHLGRSEEAMAMFGKSVEARPNFAAACNEIGKIHLEREEYDEAIRSFVKAIGIDPRTEYVRNLQIAFSKKGQ